MIEIQAALPAIVNAPLAIVIGVVFFTTFNEDTILNTVIIRVGENVLTISDFAYFSFALNQMLDALVTLIIVKPYRLATIQIFKNVKHKVVGGNISTSSVTEMGIARNRAR